MQYENVMRHKPSLFIYISFILARCVLNSTRSCWISFSSCSFVFSGISNHPFYILFMHRKNINMSQSYLSHDLTLRQVFPCLLSFPQDFPFFLAVFHPRYKVIFGNVDVCWDTNNLFFTSNCWTFSLFLLLFVCFDFQNVKWFRSLGYFFLRIGFIKNIWSTLHVNYYMYMLSTYPFSNKMYEVRTPY